MLKKLSILLFILSIMMGIFALASCSDPVWYYDETYHWHEEEGEITDKAEHIPSDWYVVEEATAEKPGSRHIICKICRKELQVETTYFGEHTPHTAGDWVIEKEPTIEENGLRSRYCTVCNELVESEEITAYKYDLSYSGKGTYEEPFLVRNYDELNGIREKDGEGVYFRLIYDIDLADYTFEPFADFYGNFNGDNKHIYNFYTADGSLAEIGLFRKNHGTIANLKLASYGDGKYYIGVIPDKQTVCCGALVGDNYGNVYNCSAENAEVRVNSSYNTGSDGMTTVNVGGLIGKVSSGEVKGCYGVNNVIYGNAKNASGTSSSFRATVYAGGVIGLSCSTVSHCYGYGNDLEATVWAYYHTTSLGCDYYYGKTFEQMGGIIGCVSSSSTATALIGYQNKFKATHTAGSGSNGTFIKYYGSYSYNFGEAVGSNSGTIQYIYGKTGDSVSVAGSAGTSYYCEQTDIATFDKLPVFRSEGIWALDVTRVETEVGEGEDPIVEETYNVAFKEDYAYKFEKPAEPIENIE